MKRFLTTAALVASAIAGPAQANTIVATLPEFNGNGTIANTYIGTFSYLIPAGQTIASVLFESAFGNSTVNSSATGTVSVDGVQVGDCPGTGNPCWNGPGAPISYAFSASDFGLFADGSADLYYNQTDCCVIRLPESTLTIETVPEPQTLAIALSALALAGFARRRRG